MNISVDKLTNGDDIFVHVRDVVETIEAAGDPSSWSHEIVMPPCIIIWGFPGNEPEYASTIQLSQFGSHLCGYTVRCDSNAHAIDIVPKLVEEPLPFE